MRWRWNIDCGGGGGIPTVLGWNSDDGGGIATAEDGITTVEDRIATKYLHNNSGK
jgi:hypothetical protein